MKQLAVPSIVILLLAVKLSEEILTGEVELYSTDEGIRILNGLSPPDHVFLGANETIHIYSSTSQIQETDIGACYDLGSFGCHTQGTSKEDCHNFIRGVTILDESCDRPDTNDCSRLYFSGTNALKPANFFCDYTPPSLKCQFTTNTEDADCENMNIAATDAFQRLKEENATFLFHDNRTFFGVLETKNNPSAMVGVADIDISSGQLGSKVRTRSDSQKQVTSDAKFVGTPFYEGDYTFILFRETALEYESLFDDQETAIYSRIARVCSNDEGTSASGITWTSFLKQRLVCSQETNDVGFYNVYDEIQDFVQYKEGDHIVIYGIFTNSRVATDAVSAVCKFNLTEITNTFQTGKFFGSSGSVAGDAWREYDGTAVSPRPGYDCNSPNTAQTDFLRDYSATKPDAVSEAECVVGEDRFSNIIKNDSTFIISSEAGCFYKYTPGSCIFDESNKFCPVEFQNKPIRDMAQADKNTVMVVTEDGAFTVSFSESGSLIQLVPDSATVAPNTDFIGLAKCTDPQCSVSCEYETEALEPYLFKAVYLDADETILQFSVRIINETVICTVSDSFGKEEGITISTYQEYTKYQCESRDIEWLRYNQTHAELSQNDACGKATQADQGWFESKILYNGKPEIKNCSDCSYADCETQSCPFV